MNFEAASMSLIATQIITALMSVRKYPGYELIFILCLYGVVYYE